jgi:hypothetical protein
MSTRSECSEIFPPAPGGAAAVSGLGLDDDLVDLHRRPLPELIEDRSVLGEHLVDTRHRCRHHLPQGVGRLEQQRHDAGADAQLTLSYLREEILHDVGELAEVIEAEGEGVSLQGVHRPKHRGDELGVVRMDLQRHEELLRQSEALVRLHQKALEYGLAIEIHAHRVPTLRASF